MLTTVEVRNSQGDLLSLPLEDATAGFIVADIQGLDPVKATLVSSSFAQLDGTQYQSSRREARNIVIRLELDPDYITTSVRDLRNRLYDFFMPKAEVNLRFIMSDDLSVDIMGRVETCESPLFTQNPDIHISVMCFKPDFIDLVPVELSGETTATSTETMVPYEGTVEAGIQFVLNVDRTLTEFTFYHRPPDGSLRTLDFAAPLEDGDVLTISTVPGAKGATLTRDGTDSPILYGISPQSNWIAFSRGENHIRVYAEGDEIPFDIVYTPRYGGL